MPQVEVTFDIDANGIINVSAKDKATNNEQKITITSSSGLSKDEVEKMAKDAELHSADDRKKKEEIESRNRADSMVYNIEKMLKEHRDKVGEEDAKAVEAALEDTKKAMQEGGVDQINQATSKLETASHKLAEAMYKRRRRPRAGRRARRAERRRGASGQAAGDGHARRKAERQRGRRRVRRRRRQEVSCSSARRVAVLGAGRAYLIQNDYGSQERLLRNSRCAQRRQGRRDPQELSQARAQVSS